MSRFENINAIVTGGSSGIGQNVAERIADEGGKVIVWDKKLYHEKTIRNDRPYARKVKAAVDSGQAYYKDTLPKHIYMYELRS